MSERLATLGIDLGTTTAKAIAFADEDGREVTEVRETVERHTDPDGAAEQDPEAVAEAATQVLTRAATEARAAGFSIARIGLSAGMHSLLAVGGDGRPLSRAMLWMDRRADAEARQLWEMPSGRALYARTGAPVHPMMPVVKLAWLRRARPEIHRRAARFVSLKEWVWHEWFGEWEVDQSIANATGLYDVHRDAWDPEALAFASIEAGRLSPIVATTAARRGLRPAVARATGLAPDVPFVIGASDGVLANLGVGAIDRRHLCLTVGTSLTARVGADHPETDAAIRSFCYVLGPGRFVVGGPSNSGGLVLDWVCRQLLGAESRPGGMPALLDAAAGVDVGSLLCLPYLAGERAPLWDARARGVFAGLDIDHGPAHLVRAAVEGVALNAGWIVSGLLGLVGRPDEVVATGHVLGQPWIRQIVADTLDLPVRDGGDRDASVAGAAFLARIATGSVTWEDAAALAARARGEPTLPRPGDLYREKYARFRRLVDALRGTPGGDDALW
jgi:gluconokinase